MFYGAAYHPEMFSPERWRYDAELMRKAHFNMVRIGEFSWGRMEPEPGTYTFGWLDAAIEILNAQGIQVMIGTPTAGPPTWITNARNGQPDCRMLYEDGIRWEAGGRSQCCVKHPFFIERSRLIASALGAHYAHHPGVSSFQIDNEIGMFGTRCYCEACLAGFRDWLAAKYATIEQLNARLGMRFGSNEVRDFADIPLPRRRQDMHNPGLLVDSQRFYSACNVAFVQVQIQALHEAGVRQPITTNVCHMFSGTDTTAIDNAALFADLDVVGWDCYPTQFAADPPPALLGLLHEMARGYKKRRYWMLEEQSGSPDGLMADDIRRIRLWTWQAIAHGAEMINYWLWRTHRYGAEQYFRGILDHDGDVNGRYQVVAQTGAEAQRLATILDGVERKNAVAILLDFDSSQSLMLVPPTSALATVFYREHAQEFFAALQTLGLSADVVYDAKDLHGYRVVIAPALRLVNAVLADQLKAYVSQGGTLITSILTATLDRDHVALSERPPYLLKDVLGVERIEWGSLGAVTTPPKEMKGINHEAWASLHSSKGLVPVQAHDEYGLSGVYSARLWYDHVQAHTARVLATFAEGSPVADAPALTLNRYGQGQAFAFASVMDQRFYADVLRSVLKNPEPAVRPANAEPTIEIVPCQHGAEEIYFVLNHARDTCALTLSGDFQELITETSVSATFDLAGYAVAILKQLP